MFIVTLTLLSIIFFSLWLYFRIKMQHVIELGEKIPGPKPLPLIGNILEFGTSVKDITANMVRLALEYKDIIRFWIGPDLIVVLREPKHVEAVLTNNKELTKAWVYKFLEPWLGQGLLTSSGQKWRRHRKLITPAFHFRILEQFVNVFIAKAEILIKQLSTHVDGPEFDIYPYITLCALDNICETAMGVNVNAQEDSNSEYVTAIRRMCETILMRAIKPWLLVDCIFKRTSLGKQYAKYKTTLHEMTRNVIKKRKQELLQNGKPRILVNDLDTIGRKKLVPFLDLLILSAEDGDVLTDEELREEVDTIMFEGHDTTASALSFACYLLSHYPDIQEKVMAELYEIFGNSNRPATYQDLHEMKYLEQVIKETLRLFPSVPVYGRKIVEDLDIGDYILPAGTNVVIATPGMHYHEKYFPNPRSFNPENFSSENIKNRNPFSYVPFAAGPRNCIGQKYAMLELKATLCQLLRRFKLVKGTTPITEIFELVLKSSTGFNIQLETR